jgi:predicted transcriptional regulator YdeE
LISAGKNILPTPDIGLSQPPFSFVVIQKTNEMHTQKIGTFNVVGIAVRTTNENGQSAKDITALWQRFMSENIAGKIQHKTGNDIYCIYTDYEKDHTRPYTTILGCKVTSLNDIPTGMTGKTINEAVYTNHTVEGNILQGLIFDEWIKIWNSNLPRAFTSDFEVYGIKAQNPEDAVVDIFIAVNDI